MWLKFSRFVSLLVAKGSVVLVFFIGVLYVVSLSQNYRNDTTQVTNAAFAITATLASLCFACARSLENDDKDRDRFTYSGERFLHASILLITASLLKYALLSMRSQQLGQTLSLIINVATMPLGICVSALFMFALLDAHAGLKICSEILWNRTQRHSDWDKLM